MTAERDEPARIELRVTAKLDAESLAEEIVGAVGTDEDGTSMVKGLPDALRREMQISLSRKE